MENMKKPYNGDAIQMCHLVKLGLPNISTSSLFYCSGEKKWDSDTIVWLTRPVI